MRTLLCLPLLLPVLLTAGADEAPALSPEQPYQARKSNPVTYEVDFAVAVTAPYHTHVLNVWLPLATSDSAQEVEDGDITTFPMKVTPRISVEKKFGNKFAYFEFKEPQGAQIIRRKFTVKVPELHWDLDPAKVKAPAEWPAAFAPYLEGDQSVAIDESLKGLLPKVVPERGNPASELASVLDWVNSNMTYDHNNASLKASSKHALSQRHGHCSDYHGLCAAFGRALGFPTRITYGINPFPKASPSHCKLEAYLPPYGWVSFDVSETQRLIEEIGKAPALSKDEKAKLTRAARERLLKGFRDNTWYLQTRGTDYELVPPAARKVPVVRTIYAEADGVALPDPDPSAKGKKEFAWMTAHEYTASKKVPYPFKDWKTLETQP
jgi:transglutaminase-like putative cysteine protease